MKVLRCAVKPWSINSSSLRRDHAQTQPEPVDCPLHSQPDTTSGGSCGAFEGAWNFWAEVWSLTRLSSRLEKIAPRDRCTPASSFSRRVLRVLDNPHLTAGLILFNIHLSSVLELPSEYTSPLRWPTLQSRRTRRASRLTRLLNRPNYHLLRPRSRQRQTIPFHR